MSRAFMWFLLVFSVLMLLVQAFAATGAKPAVVALWLVIGGFASYRLFRKKASGH